MYGYLYCENWGLDWLSDDVGFVPNLNINVENFLFYVSRTLHAHAGLSMHAHELWLCAQDDSCVHMLRASLALLFQK